MRHRAPLRPFKTFDNRSLSIMRTRLATTKRRILTRNPMKAEAKRAAVLIPLVNLQGNASVIFTRRTEKVTTHKGQVAFPGGVVDSSDRDFVHTALRETHEEIGIADNDVQVLGMHHDAFSAAGVLVTPIIGFLGDFEKLQFRASAHEIDHIFAVSLVDLYDPSKQAIDAHSSERYKTKLKIFSGGLFPIWGLTAYMLDNALSEILAENANVSVESSSL